MQPARFEWRHGDRVRGRAIPKRVQRSEGSADFAEERRLLGAETVARQTRLERIALRRRSGCVPGSGDLDRRLQQPTLASECFERRRQVLQPVVACPGCRYDLPPSRVDLRGCRFAARARERSLRPERAGPRKFLFQAYRDLRERVLALERIHPPDP